MKEHSNNGKYMSTGRFPQVKVSKPNAEHSWSHTEAITIDYFCCQVSLPIGWGEPRSNSLLDDFYFLVGLIYIHELIIIVSQRPDIVSHAPGHIIRAWKIAPPQ